MGETKIGGCATGGNPLSKRCIELLVKKLETKGTLLDLHGGGRSEMSENTVHDVTNRLLASPKKSLCVLSQEIGLSRSTCQRAAAKKAGVQRFDCGFQQVVCFVLPTSFLRIPKTHNHI
jgi:hypothetical protein